MTFLSQNSVVGELVVQEVFLYYDGPRLFVANNPIGQKYLINSLSSDDQNDTWLAVALSDKRLSALRSRTLDVHDAFAKPELGFVIELTSNKSGLLVSSSIKKPDQLQPDDLPEPGAFLQPALPNAAPPAQGVSFSSDLTFITNEPDNLLANRFGKLLAKDTRFFDCLVGYFFISGFYKLYPALENIERIRILVGLKIDHTAYKLYQQGKKPQNTLLRSHAQTAQQVSAEVLNELENSDDAPKVEEGVHKFVEWVKSGKLEIKAHATEDLHAKVYIMTFSETDRDKGRVITGSSNLSQSGLHDHLEFNVELKNRSDYEFALNKFNQLWAAAVDVRKPFEETITTRSPYSQFSPYELYLKFLYEYFRTELNRPSELEGAYVPIGFKKLKYQEEAVLTAQKILEEYGGVFISDVVGLGKTYMSALLAQQLDGRCLVLAPPNLLDMDKRGSWPNVFADFQTPQTDFVSIGKLDDLLERDLSKYTNVFIDESHRFRTETTQTYEMLAQICRGKRVILVSATPLNNTPRDILSQVKLFQNGKNSTIPNLRNLEAFFLGLEKNLKGLDRQKDHQAYIDTIRENAMATREKVLKYLMIRRTRSEIEKYYGDDMKAQGLKFPEVKDPHPLFYKFSKQENEIFDETIRFLAADFKYARYKPLTYYVGKLEQRDVQSQRNLATFMKILMVKRLESSFHAFRLTLERFIHSYERMIAEFHKGYVYISKKHINKIFELLEEDNEEAIEEYLAQEKAERHSAKDFTPSFIQDLESDLKILRKVRNLWENIHRDPKWETFRDILKSDPKLKNGKLIIFTESKETAEYLSERIRKEVDPKVILFSGAGDETAHRAVISNFDANAFKPQDDYRILVSTEVLSEGVNLHRSNTVINYDIPWNPTRLIQRVGRVNRVDTKFDTIETYNFFPTQEGNDLIKLREAAEAKIHAFIEMLGADARLLTEGEEIKSHDLFVRLTSKKTITGEDEEEDSELEFLTEIREVRDKNPDLFARIKRLPKKARSSKQLAPASCEQVAHFPALITYFRQGRLDKFYVANEGTASAIELDFFSTARILKPSDVSEKRQPVPREFYPLLDTNKKAFTAATSVESDDSIPHQKGGANDAYILKRLKAREIHKYQGFTEDDEDFIEQTIQLLNDGALPRPTTKKVTEALKKEIEPLRVLGILRRDIPTPFFQSTRAQLNPYAHTPQEVILSSIFVGGSMNRAEARSLIARTFTQAFDKERFGTFVVNVLNRIDESKASAWNSQYIKDAFKEHVNRYERLGTYTSPEKEKLDILIVHLTKDSKLERARTAIRNFVADHLRTRDEKDAALVAFVSPTEKQWRFSYVKMDYASFTGESGKVEVETHLTPARRFSYLVGEGESCHTAQTRFLSLLQDTDFSPALASIEEAFSVEAVTKEFFTNYAELFNHIHKVLERNCRKDKELRNEFETNGVNTVDFAKKLLGQIVFLYFLQKKGWLGVTKGRDWGTGPHDFIRKLVESDYGRYKNFFHDTLEPLFYGTLATDRGHEAWCNKFECRIPFLNGGLFEPLGDYNWRKIDVMLPDSVFTNTTFVDEGISGNGVLDVFDRYNFTVNESEPLEKEVAIDPEMLGKVFENLIEENRRKGIGAYYTPREIVHYMCQESLVNYLDTAVNKETLVVPRTAIETFVRLGEQISHYEAVDANYNIKMPKTVQQQARLLDEKLADIAVCDPAVGSGAFPVGMMTEIVRARSALTPYFNDVRERTAYHFKRHAIQNCLYGVDIDPGAVEIARLRLWLSLVVDEEHTEQIKPLPNLDFKVVSGNSLIGFPFRSHGLAEVEALKSKFFEETGHERKAALKRQIESKLSECFAGSKRSLGYEVNFDFDVNFSEVTHRGGFDVIIANPPYGANIDDLLVQLRPIYEEAVRNYAEIYKMFMQQGLRKVRPSGTQSLITPNTFLAQPRYKDIRKILLKCRILKIVNLGEEVFENVVVPTCLSFIARSEPAPSYLFADLREKSKFSGELNQITFRDASLDTVYASGDLSLYPSKLLGKNQVTFADALEIKDAGIQYHRSGIGLKNKGGNDLYERLFSSDKGAFKSSTPVWYGKLIDRWTIQPKTDEFFNLEYRKVLRTKESVSFTQTAFEITPKILWRQTASCLQATLDTECRWFRNTIQCAYIKDNYREKLDIYYLLGVVNSEYIQNSYNALVEEAGRVFPQVKLTHVKKLPLAIPEKEMQREVGALVKKMLQAKKSDPKADMGKLEIAMNSLIDQIYGVRKGEDTMLGGLRAH